MRYLIAGLLLVLSSLVSASECLQAGDTQSRDAFYACLRQAYSEPIKYWPRPHIDAGVPWQELGPLSERAAAQGSSPVDESRVVLGERLFFDPQLSRSGQIACASCHEPDLGFADGRRISFGHDRAAGRRNAPSVVMSGFAEQPFWDGRAASLEQQALMPIEDPVEMAFTLDELLQRLNSDEHYPQRFAEVFGAAPIDATQLGQALASYQRSLVRVARNTRFERFLNGRHGQLSDQQLHGLHLFRTKARCMHCHSGPAMTDNRFHNVGLTYYGRRYQDLGRYEVTGQAQDIGAFRTPSLRLVSRTGPWMHNGLFPHLRGVLNMYNAGMPRPKPPEGLEQDPLFPQTSAHLRPLELSQLELEALRNFLETL